MIVNEASTLVINTMSKQKYKSLKDTNRLSDKEIYAIEDEEEEMEALTNSEIEELLRNFM